MNTSDGRLVDETALAEALKQGQVQAAALDDYNTEPFYRANSTCHCSGINSMTVYFTMATGKLP